VRSCVRLCYLGLTQPPWKVQAPTVHPCDAVPSTLRDEDTRLRRELSVAVDDAREGIAGLEATNGALLAKKAAFDALASEYAS
jgi:hypothetical protein